MKTEAEFWSNVRVGKPNECWPWLRSCNKQNGYGRLRWRGKKVVASRLAWVLHHKRRIPKGKYVLHRCDYPSCCNPRHLFLGTYKDNTQDCISKGRFPHLTHQYVFRGELNGSARLTEQNVRDIRKLLKQGYYHKDIALKFGVSKGAIDNISAGRKWGWLK